MFWWPPSDCSRSCTRKMAKNEAPFPKNASLVVWDMFQGSHATTTISHIQCTIKELAYHTMSCGNFFWFWFVKQPTHSNASVNFRHSLGIQMAWHRGGLHNGRGLRLKDSKFSCLAITVFRGLSKKTLESQNTPESLFFAEWFAPNPAPQNAKPPSYQHELNSQALTHQSIRQFNQLNDAQLAVCQATNCKCEGFSLKH